MINMSLLSFRNLVVIGIVAVFARSLLNGFVRLVDNGGEKEVRE